jgi:hypothetical protein
MKKETYIYFITDDVNGNYPYDFNFVIAKTEQDVLLYLKDYNKKLGRKNEITVYFNTEIGREHRKLKINKIQSYYCTGKMSLDDLKNKNNMGIYEICYELFDKNIKA